MTRVCCTWITKSPNFIIAGQGVVTGQCKVGYYCGRGSDREDPTDGVTGDICPAGRYCSKYTNNHNIGNELIMVNLP